MSMMIEFRLDGASVQKRQLLVQEVGMKREYSVRAGEMQSPEQSGAMFDRADRWILVLSTGAKLKALSLSEWSEVDCLRAVLLWATRLRQRRDPCPCIF